jgi:diaminopimelate epimerase
MNFDQNVTINHSPKNMNIHFYKYQGTGNDFVLLDNRTEKYTDLSTEQIKKICDRRFGIGADGFMMLNEKSGYDFEMVYYNSNGLEGTMCGNGGRCIVKFAHDIGIKKSEYYFLAVDGSHEAILSEDGLVSLKMQNVTGIKKYETDFVLNTGSPHFVRMTNGLKNLNVAQEGRKIRYNSYFKKEGINVNFVEIQNDDSIFVRTYERGVEDETFSCGTGVTAAALVFQKNKIGFHSVNIQTLGGNLNVTFEHTANENYYKDIWLKGAAVKVFEGNMEV